MLVKKKSGAKGWFKIALLATLPLLLVAGVVYAVFYSPLLRVRGIFIVFSPEGGNNPKITAEDILGGRKFNNILGSFPEINSSAFPEISGFTVGKNYLARTVTIEAHKRDQTMIWCLEPSGSCFWTDPDGFIFTTAPEPSGGMFIRDGSGRDIKIGDNALPPDMFANLTSALNLLKEYRVTVSEARIDNLNFQEFIVTAVGGAKFRFSLRYDPASQGGGIALKSEAGAIELGKCIDMRILPRVYTSRACSN